jgi:hypothetical protein
VSKSARERIESVLADADNREYGKTYLADLKENWKETTTAIGKTLLLAALSMTLFELLTRGAISKASYAGVEVTDLSLIRKVLPAIVAYFYLDLVVLHMRNMHLRRTYIGAFSKLYPAFKQERLEYFTAPRMHTATFMPYLIFDPKEKQGGVYVALMLSLAIVSLFLTIPLFEVYAYIIQLRRISVEDPLVWATLPVTLLIISAALLAVYRTISSEYD